LSCAATPATASVERCIRCTATTIALTAPLMSAPARVFCRTVSGHSYRAQVSALSTF
jgi:hypothetical protein